MSNHINATSIILVAGRGRERLEDMDADEYQAMALRTANKGLTDSESLLNGLMGLCGESGECIDIMKKHMFQLHEIDTNELARELGDVAWYLAVAADALGYKLGDVLKMNVEKLERRYPSGFSADRSINRSE